MIENKHNLRAVEDLTVQENPEKKEQPLPSHVRDMLAVILDKPEASEAELYKEILDLYEKKTRKNKQAEIPKQEVAPQELPELLVGTRKRIIGVLNQILSDNSKLPENATTEKILSAYRKNYKKLKTFLNMNADDYRPTDDDKKDIEILRAWFSLSGDEFEKEEEEEEEKEEEEEPAKSSANLQLDQ